MSCAFAQPPAVDAASLEALDLMSACAGQLRAAGMGVGGLDLAALFAAAAALSIAVTPRLLREVRLLEQAMLDSLRRRQEAP